MKKRVWKEPVKPEVRRDWVRRYELEGETPPKIAAEDGYDVRTVREQIKRGIEEREQRETRLVVLRDALQEHYRELCGFAETLNPRSGNGYFIEPGSPGVLAGNPYLSDALRAHLPRSPIWKYLEKREALLRRRSDLDGMIRSKISDQLAGDKRINEFRQSHEIMAAENLKDILLAQIKSWIMGEPGLNTEKDLHTNFTTDGKVNAAYGAVQLGQLTPEHSETIKWLISDLEAGIKSWSELEDMRKTNSELNKVEASLRDELAVITYRRVVPGKCKYCPV